MIRWISNKINKLLNNDEFLQKKKMNFYKKKKMNFYKKKDKFLQKKDEFLRMLVSDQICMNFLERDFLQQNCETMTQC